MQIPQIILLAICSITFIVVGLIIYIGSNYSLNQIKNRTVDNGQHGTAKFATKGEIHIVYKRLSCTPS